MKVQTLFQLYNRITKYCNIELLKIVIEFLTGVEWRAKVTWVTPCLSQRTAAWWTTDSKSQLNATHQPSMATVHHVQKTAPYSCICHMKQTNRLRENSLWRTTEHFNCRIYNKYITSLDAQICYSTMIVVALGRVILNNLTNAADSSGVELKVSGTVTVVRAGCVLTVTINTVDRIETLVHVWHHSSTVSSHSVRWRRAVDVFHVE